MYYQLGVGSSSLEAFSKLRPALSSHGFMEDDSLLVSELVSCLLSALPMPVRDDCIPCGPRS